MVLNCLKVKSILMFCFEEILREEVACLTRKDCPLVGKTGKVTPVLEWEVKRI